MSETLRRPRHRIYRRAQRGQSLVVALAVLFVLLFIGGLFVAQIARNLAFAGRNRDTGVAEQLADAGINYCALMLTRSEDGADWRPVPTAPLNNSGPSDPDYEWLAQGFERITGNGGRTLVHVTYDPNPDDPRSGMLRLESIGRPGDIGNGLDPTVFVQNGPAPRLRAERIAYQKIGLTDYLRFITDKDQTNQEAELGAPTGLHNLATVFGDPTIANNLSGVYNNNLLFGGPIFSNAPLRFVGDTFIYESARGNSSPSYSPEGVFVANKLLLGPTRKTTGAPGNADGDYQVGVNVPINAGATYSGTNIPNIPTSGLVLPSDDSNFDSHQGVVRDGSTNADKYGYSRSVPRLNPPSIDTPAVGTDIPRYREMSRNSGVWITPTYNSGQGGWGRNIYINNLDDLQRETTVPGVNGGYSQRAEWLDPNIPSAKGKWNGPTYTPPAVQIDLMGDHAHLVRSDSRSFVDIHGNPITQQGGKVVDIPFRDSDRDTYTDATGKTYALPHLDKAGDDPSVNGPRPFGDANSYGNNLVIYAEGNVRVRGIYGAVTDLKNPNSGDRLARVHLTIVSNGTIYIDGNVVKGDGYLDTSGVFHPERASTLALIAKDYVCVNTTQFVAAQNQSTNWTLNDGSDSYHLDIGPGQAFDASFSFGVDPSTYTANSGAYASPLFLLLRHAGVGAPAFINLLLNESLGSTLPTSVNGQLINYNTSVYAFNSAPVNGPKKVGSDQMLFTYPVGQNGGGLYPHFESRAFPLRGHYDNNIFLPDYSTLDNTVNASLFFPTLIGVNHAFVGTTVDGPPLPGYENTMQFQLDQGAASNSAGPASLADYFLSSAVVAPLDIRVEALIYAQERSFFIIPGYPVNMDPADSRTAYDPNDANSLRAVDPNKAIYPFYNEPTDIRLTIYGAIAENHTASQADQAAWLARFGYIPAQMGSSGIPVPDDHLTVHDPTLYDAAKKVNYQYNPGEDKTADFRTVLETNPQSGEFPITHGLRFVYDPAFALPYIKPSDPTSAGDTAADKARRDGRALRFVVNTVGTSKFIEKLPALPRLPVCPDTIQFSDDQRTIGGP